MLDSFLIEVAVLLGVTQTELENGYYMVDLPAIIESKRKNIAVNRFYDIYTLLATNHRALESEESTSFIRGISKEIGVKEPDNFDRSKFEELRALTGMGGNLAR
jgi:hypothetical protein